MLSARAFNAFLETRRRHRLIDVRQDAPSLWRHPWSVSVGFDPSLKQWRAAIKPGFVNGLAPTLPTADGDKRLTEYPLWPLSSFRAIGPGSQPVTVDPAGGTLRASYEEVPAFFKFLGVGPAPTIDPNTGAIIQSGTEEDRAKQRQLRACDIVLYQDHPATTGSVAINTAAAGTTLQIDAVFTDGARLRKRPYLRQMSRYVPPAAAADALTAALNGWEDLPRSEVLVATIYFLSQPGISPLAELDGLWTPYVRHQLFYNLNHATNALPPKLKSEPLRLLLGLAGGVGDFITQALLAQVNDGNSVVSNYFTAQRVTGKFWSV